MRYSLLFLSLGGLVLASVIGSWSRWGPNEELPELAISSPTQAVGMERCSQCHPLRCAMFRGAPHMQTLSRASEPEIVAHFAGKTFQSKTGEVEIEIVKRDGGLCLESNRWPEPIRIDWVFGSGQHAQTPVATWINPQGQTVSRELSLSWYPDIEGLDLTLGRESGKNEEGASWSIGVAQSHSETRACFGCHTSYLPIDEGRIGQDRLVAGVRCQRCHLNGRAHAEAMEAGETERGLAVMSDWSELTPRQSIFRCGECHRRPDQLPPEDVRPSNEMILRFAPVGLSQSPCFRKQETVHLPDGSVARLDCTTCHNPHQPARSDPAYYVEKCLSCHGTHSRQAPVCAAEPMTSACLNCHMPTVEVQDHLWFTDHWIRVRDR